MSNNLESKAVFWAKIDKLGLTSAKAKFTELGWETLADFAFASSKAPDVINDTEFNDQIVTPLLGQSPVAVQRVRLRRLFTEAYTLFAADLNSQVNRVDDPDKPKKLAPQERKERFAQCQRELTGVELKGEREPSHHIVDKFVAMQESGELRIVEWHEITKREQELRNEKKDPQWVLENNGLFKREATPELYAIRRPMGNSSPLWKGEEWRCKWLDS